MAETHEQEPIQQELTQQEPKARSTSRRNTAAERRLYLAKLYVLLALIALLLAALLVLTTDPRSDVEADQGDEAVTLDTEEEPVRGVPEPDFREPDITPQEPLPRPAPVPDADPPEEPVPAEPVPVPSGDLYLVLDDAGYSMWELEPFLSLGVPLTVSILPHLSFSEEAARATVRAGHDVMLHMPMEALGGGDPGPGAILREHDSGEIGMRILSALDSVPYAVAANNHMGSAVTEQARSMQVILETLHAQGVFFLDSRTTADTVVARVGSELGIQTVERHIFVDHYRDVERMREALRAGIDRASSEGYAVLIGHVQTRELPELIQEAAVYAAAAGVAFRPVSHLAVRYAGLVQ